MSVSECCGAPMSGEMVDVGICPDCLEHCDVVDEEEEEEEEEEDDE